MSSKISDGYHTMDELYYHRGVLFSVICNQNNDLAWKSRKHSDDTMYDGMFIAGIDTPEGQYTYHCENDLWDLFDVKELENATEWDGHKPKDIVRLLSLKRQNKITDTEVIRIDSTKEIIFVNKMDKDKLKEQILSVKSSGLTKMFDTDGVKSIARKLGYTELVTYLNQENNNYFAFAMFGEDL